MYETITAVERIAFPQAVALPLYEKQTALPQAYAKLPGPVRQALQAALGQPDFKPAAGSALRLDTTAEPRVFVLGLGPQEQFHANHLRSACAKLSPMLHQAKIESLAVHAELFTDQAQHAATAIGEGLGLGAFAFDRFKGTAKNNGPTDDGPRKLSFSIHPHTAHPALEQALTVARSVNLARELAATPPNVAHPAYLADECRKLARQVGLKCSVIDAKKAASLNMGGLLAVGGAGSTPPCLICLEWNGPSQVTTRGSQAAPILLVGKAVTFDTGGYSIKPTESMLSMKYDKCGGMAVIGAMHAIATLGLPVRVVGLIPAAENMIGQTAYRPSDILRLTNGVTVEVNNTDAEGRLILSDALAYGCKAYKPQAVIDLATLTGAIVVALGPWCAGLFCNDERLYDRLQSASEVTGERLWRMPLWPEHRKHIKATHGDILNSGGREASACTAAAFLSHFVAKGGDFKKNEKLPWAHIDIAGVSDVNTERDPTGIYPKGPTGYGIRLLVELLENWGS